MLLLEVVLGPFWVYLRFGDVPSAWVVGGGALLLGTLAWHELVAAAGGGARKPTEFAAHEQDERPYHAIDRREGL